MLFWLTVQIWTLLSSFFSISRKKLLNKIVGVYCKIISIMIYAIFEVLDV